MGYHHNQSSHYNPVAAGSHIADSHNHHNHSQQQHPVSRGGTTVSGIVRQQVNNFMNFNQ
jgi:hypothetical protein